MAGAGEPRGIGAWTRWRTRSRTPDADFWALRDISFAVERGEAFGVIGRNGAGKSTLLKLLTGITAPSEGEIRIRGRIAALIEVGSGFHPELTGRENVFLSGSILGLRTREIRARLDEIVDFAGIGKFLDMPVKFYSSGMYVRLGFAIAAHLEPDVLLVDEALAVGDAEFQARCVSRIEALKRRGVTMVFVSHDLGAIEQLCGRAALLDRGRIATSGPAQQVVMAYQQLTSGAGAASGPDETARPDGDLEILSLSLLSASGAATLAAVAGEPLTARVKLAARRAADVEVVVSFYDFERGTLLADCSSRASLDPFVVPVGESTVDFVIPELLLGAGVYTLGVTARPMASAQPVAWRFGRTTLYVEGRQQRRGAFLLPFTCRASAIDPPVAANPPSFGRRSALTR